MLSLGSELKFGTLGKGFQLEVRRDPEFERTIYKAGVELEGSLKDPKSLAYKIFQRLSSSEGPDLTATEAQGTLGSPK